METVMQRIAKHFRNLQRRLELLFLANDEN